MPRSISIVFAIVAVIVVAGWIASSPVAIGGQAITMLALWTVAYLALRAEWRSHADS